MTGAKGNVIVTGGAGYIGSHAAKALSAAGYTPVTYDNLSIGNAGAVRWGPLEIGDIADPARLTEVFLKYAPVGVLHFAALALVGESMVEPSLYYRTNVGGAIAVMDAARAAKARAFVFSSTCAVYGTPPDGPIDEKTPTAPINPYGASKLMVERALADYRMAYGLPYVALRYFNAAGADPEGEIGELRGIETHLIPLAIEAMLGRRGPITVLGTDYPTPDGTAIRDYIHVSDLAAAHVRALEHLLAGRAPCVLNLGTGTGHSVREVLSAIGEIAGRPVPSEDHPRRPGDPPALVARADAARKAFGANLTPLSDLRSIVTTAIAWHESDFVGTAHRFGTKSALPPRDAT